VEGWGSVSIRSKELRSTTVSRLVRTYESKEMESNQQYIHTDMSVQNILTLYGCQFYLSTFSYASRSLIATRSIPVRIRIDFDFREAILTLAKTIQVKLRSGIVLKVSDGHVRARVPVYLNRVLLRNG
jgi:hypothetical protein